MRTNQCATRVDPSYAKCAHVHLEHASPWIDILLTAAFVELGLKARWTPRQKVLSAFNRPCLHFSICRFSFVSTDSPVISDIELCDRGKMPTSHTDSVQKAMPLKTEPLDQISKQPVLNGDVASAKSKIDSIASINFKTKGLNEFNELISCHLCKGYLIDATTIVECLHSCELLKPHFLVFL